jgi:hypothetical protein
MRRIIAAAIDAAAMAANAHAATMSGALVSTSAARGPRRRQRWLRRGRWAWWSRFRARRWPRPRGRLSRYIVWRCVHGGRAKADEPDAPAPAAIGSRGAAGIACRVAFLRKPARPAHGYGITGQTTREALKLYGTQL